MRLWCRCGGTAHIGCVFSLPADGHTNNLVGYVVIHTLDGILKARAISKSPVLTRATVLGAAAIALAGAASAHAQAGPCTDPAMPLVELAREFDWRPSERSARRAYPALQAYLHTGDARDNRQAALAYRAVLSQDPHDAHAQNALALLYAAGPDLNYPEAGTYRYTSQAGFSNASVTGSRMLRERVAADSTLWLHAVALTRMALASPSRARLEQAQHAIERGLLFDADHTALRLALRDLHVLAQRYHEALDVIRDTGPRCVAVMHAHAEALILNGDTAAGVRLYIHALESAGPNELHRFEDDIGTTITRAQRAQLRAVPAARRGEWIRSFWEHDAAAAGRTIETRIVDHIQRAAWANANDRAPIMPPSSNRVISFVTDTIHRVPWGARGILYTRHGPPHRLYRAQYGTVEYEGWVYRVEDVAWTVIFARGEDETTREPEAPPGDDDSGSIMTDPQPEQLTDVAADPRTGGWRVVVSRGCMNSGSFLGVFQPDRMAQRMDAGETLDIREMYIAMSEFEPRFGDMAHHCTVAAAGMSYRPLIDLTRLWTWENESRSPHLFWRASAVPSFTHRLRIAASAYHFRGVGGEPELVALFWVPSSDLSAGTNDPTDELRLTFAIVDSMVGSTRRDVTLSIPNRSPAGVLGTSVVWRGDDVRSGTMRVVAVDAADSTRGGTVTARVAEPYAPEPVSMSDLVLAGSAAAGSLVRGSYNVSPLPDHAVQQDRAVRVFFELYGVEEDRAIETSITIVPDRPRSIRESLGFGGNGDRTLSFVTEASLDDRRVAVQDFDLGGDLEPGAYFVDVAVCIEGHELARRTHLIVLPLNP